ncbi:MAG: hypothetical protein N2246_05320 [Candidatus Sumerlaeia bacterium]|nr:hypothetical protein [Candidatus Sumerlaeia bacterium]
MFREKSVSKIFVILSILLAGIVSAVQGGFSVLQVTNNIADDANPDIARDASGNLHLVYEREGCIYYKFGTPFNWSEEEKIGEGSMPAIALDSEGNPHIVYVYGKNTIHYIKRKAKSWLEPEVVASGNYADLDVDSAGNAHIVYVNPWADEDKYNEIFYATNAEGKFTNIEFLYDSYYDPELKIGNYYSNPCIKVDSAGKYHLTLIFRYWSSWNGEPDFDYIRYRTNAEKGLESQSPEMTYYSTDLTKNALCLDEKGTPHIVYSSNNTIYYTNAPFPSWNCVSLSAGSQCALDIISNTVSITFNCNGNIFYMGRNASNFNLPQLVSSGTNPDLVLGNTAIVFVKNDGFDNEIYLAIDEPAPTPICTPVFTETQTPITDILISPTPTTTPTQTPVTTSTPTPLSL